MNVFDELKQHMKMQNVNFRTVSVLHQANVRENRREDEKKKKRER